MNQTVSHKQEAPAVDPALQQLEAIEQPVFASFNRLPNPRKAIVMLAGSTVVGAFIEGYTVSGSTTRGFIHAGAELGSKAINVASNTMRS